MAKDETARGRRATLRFAPLAAVGLAAVLLAAMLALIATLAMQSYQSAIANGENRARSAAQVVAAHMQWMVLAADQALRRIDLSVAGTADWDEAEAVREIHQAVGSLPEGFQYSVYDARGRLRMSSEAEPHTVDVSDRPYFQQLRDGENLVVSTLLRERLTGQNVFVIARRLSSADFVGIASIAIPASRMYNFWQAIDLGGGSAVSVVRNDGWLVARFPPLPEAMDLSSSPLFTTYLPMQPNGFYHSQASPADGRSRIVGYWTIEGWPLIALAGVERGVVLQPFWAQLRAQLAFGIPAFAVLLLGLFWIGRLLRADYHRRLQLEESLEINRNLLREIHHRVKNNLQAVGALVALQPLPREARDDLGRRIAAMIAVHEQIYRADQFDRVEVAPYAERLVRDIATGYESRVDISFSSAPLTVARDQALPLGMILNEVVSNAFKHAFRARGQGKLTVEISETGAGQAKVVIRDDGPGTQGGDGGGMGSRLIAGFVDQLDGTCEVIVDGGTVFTLVFPLGGGAEDHPAPAPGVALGQAAA